MEHEEALHLDHAFRESRRAVVALAEGKWLLDGSCVEGHPAQGVPADAIQFWTERVPALYECALLFD